MSLVMMKRIIQLCLVIDVTQMSQLDQAQSVYVELTWSLKVNQELDKCLIVLTKHRWSIKVFCINRVDSGNTVYLVFVE